MQTITEIVNNLHINIDLIIIALILMTLDILTGVVGAFIKHEFQSGVFREGLYKKVYEIILILIGYILDYVLKLDYIARALNLMIIGLEAYSITIENASEYVPIPSWLKTIIETLKTQSPTQNKEAEEEEQIL